MKNNDWDDKNISYRTIYIECYPKTKGVRKMKDETKFLVITNPFMWPLELGILTAVVVKNLFSGVYKDCKYIVKKL